MSYKDVFIFTNEEKKNITIVFISIIFFVICFVISQLIMPENCYLFSDNIESGFACDGVDFTNPRPCSVCEDRAKASVASTIAGLGICMLFLPFFVLAIKSLQNRPVKETKIFD